jgi:peroxiredoxin
MKKIFLALLLSPLVVFSQNEPKNFTLTGVLPGVADGTDIHLYRDGQNEEIANAKVLKGSFVLKGAVPEPTLCFIVAGNGNPIEVYVENNKMTLSADKTHQGKFLITGSKSHLDFVEFANVFTPLVQQLSSLATSINAMAPGPDRDGLMNIYTNTQQNIQAEIDKYIAHKPSSIVSAFALKITSGFYDDPVLLEKRFNQLDKVVKNTEEGKALAQKIADAKIGAVGTQALDFTQPDTTGKPVTLSSFHGKYVLVDFWASWCGPCRNENPNVVENYQKFRNKNFTVLGVSLDRPGQKENWIKAIQMDGLTWSHVSDLQFWNNAAAKLYHISQIPQNMLLDPDGKIIAKNLRGPALQAKLCEIFGCN